MRRHSDEIKAAVMAALLAGMTVMEASRKYNLPKATVSRIRNEIAPAQLEQIGTEKRDRLDDLLLEGLASNLKAQKRIVEAVSEKEYLQGQSASAVAELYTAIADKAIQLLEAASAAQSDGGESEGTTTP